MRLSIITVPDLKKLIDSKARRLTVIDARTLEEFQTGHIEGALSLVWHDLCAQPPDFVSESFRQPGWWGQFFDPTEFDYETKFGELGIGSNDEIVIYGDGPRTKGRDGIIAWLLLYLGAQNVSLLDGGWSQWLKGGNKASLSEREVKEAVFIKSVDGERIIPSEKLNYRLSETPSPSIWDARTKNEFSGGEPSYLFRRGRLPSAKLFDYYEIYNKSDTTFLSGDKYLSLLESLGHDQDRNIVAYCEMGLRAATIAFLHEVYTGKKVKLLRGGFFLWSHKDSLPVV